MPTSKSTFWRNSLDITGSERIILIISKANNGSSQIVNAYLILLTNFSITGLLSTPSSVDNSFINRNNDAETKLMSDDSSVAHPKIFLVFREIIGSP